MGLVHRIYPAASFIQACTSDQELRDSATDSPTASLTSCCYTIQCSRPLPTIDCAKSVKNTLLPHRVLAFCNRVIVLTRRWLPFMYIIGMLASVVVPFVKAEPGRYLAVCVLGFQIIPFFTSVLVLRYDMVCLVLSTFEFWYIAVKNVIANTLLGMMYDDSRACVAVMAMLGLFVPFLIDASYRDAGMAVMASTGAALAIMCSLVLCGMNMIDATREFVFIRTTKRHIEVDDAVSNLMGTIAMLLLRNAYRKHHSIVQQSRDSDKTRNKALARCITYHCHIKLEAATTTSTECFAEHPTAGSHVVQLKLVHADSAFEATNVLLPRRIIQPSLAPWPTYHQSLLHVLGCASLISTCTALIGSSHQLCFIASIVSLATTTVFITIYASLYQRQLLRRLFHSFDYIFISTHSTLLHLGACDLMYWDHRALAILASWMWTHWLITLDAVTPVMKHKLGYNKHMAILVTLASLLEQTILGLELVFLDYRHLQDRVLFTIHLHNHVKPIRVVPLVLGRLITTVLWTGRILWRILDRRGSELIMLLGRVEYDDVELVRRRKRKRESN